MAIPEASRLLHDPADLHGGCTVLWSYFPYYAYFKRPE